MHGVAVLAFDDGLVADADIQRHVAAYGRPHGQRLCGECQWASQASENHRGAKPDVGHLTPHDRQSGQCIPARALVQPDSVEADCGSSPGWVEDHHKGRSCLVDRLPNDGATEARQPHTNTDGGRHTGRARRSFLDSIF